MPIDPKAEIEVTAFDWVPDFARGLVRDLRPRWACEELGLAYCERLISAVERPDWYFAEQPWGQVPVLHDGDIKLFESGAMLLHLAERESKLLPTSGQGRADVLSWLFAAFNNVEPLFIELANVTIFAAGKPWAEQRKPGLLRAIAQKLERLEQALGMRDWLAGEFSIADIAMVSILRIGGPDLLAGEFSIADIAMVSILRIGGPDLLAEAPALRTYLERGEARPAFQAALAAQLAAFKTEQPA